MATKPNLSMAERLSANMKIRLAQCKRVYPGLEKTQLSQKANAIEVEIYESCTSSYDYQTRCEAAIEALVVPGSKNGSFTSAGDMYVPAVDSPVERIGPYAATYHASGLFSTVYRSASVSESKGAIAIKLTTPSRMTAPHNSYREARLLRLAKSETVMPLYSAESITGGHYILTMPFLPFEFGALLDKGSLTRSQIRCHLFSMFTALAHCHSLGILHRDVKPSNLLLASPSGPAFLADFGIAWKQDDPESERIDDKITDIGTTCYRAPELLFGNSAYGEEVDLWAAGCVVAEAENQGKQLFDSGDVGSELALIKSIFSTLGTPDDKSWPEAKSFPDWGKMAFKKYPAMKWNDILSKASDDGRDLVQSLIRYESKQRMSAAVVLKQSYFNAQHSQP